MAAGSHVATRKRPALAVYNGEYEAIATVLEDDALLPDKDIVDGLMRLSRDKQLECLRCSKETVSELVQQYSQDISCSGCVRTLKASLAFPVTSQGLMAAFFKEDGAGNIELDDSIQVAPEVELGRLFAAFNAGNYFARKGQARRQRCSLHTAHPRIDEDWLHVWEDMHVTLQQQVAYLDVDELSDALTTHLKNLYFCRDCRGNVLRALDLLVGYVEPEDLPIDEEFCEEYFHPFSLSTEVDTQDDEAGEGGEPKAGQRERDGDGDSLGRLDDVDDDFPANLDDYLVVAPNSVDRQAKIHRPSRTTGAYDSDNSDGCASDEHAASSDAGGLHGADCACEDDLMGAEPTDHLHSHSHSNHHGNTCEQENRALALTGGTRTGPAGMQVGPLNGTDLACLYEEGSCDDSDSDSGSEFDYCPAATHVSCLLEEVPELVRKAIEADERDEASRANGQNSDRHAPTLKDGQKELLHCIGKLLLSRIKELWIVQLVRAQTDELLVWLILSAMRTNVQQAVLTDRGNDALLLLLEEEDREKQAADKKRTKKKGKKKAKKPKAREDNDNEPPAPPAEIPTANNNKTGKRTASPHASPAGEPADKCKDDVPSPSSQGQGPGWSEDSEARLMAQLSSQLPEGERSLGAVNAALQATARAEASEASLDFGQMAASLRGFDTAGMQEDFMDGDDDDALTEEEIREAQKELEAMMAKSSREQLRANLREKFDNLCLKTNN